MKELVEREIKKIIKIFEDNNYNQEDKINFLKCKLELATIYQNEIEIEACQYIFEILKNQN